MSKILIIANDTTYTYNLRDVLIKRLTGEGYDVVIASEKLRHCEELEKLGARLVDVRTKRRSTNPFNDLALLRRYKRVIRDEKPDVVLTYNIKPDIYGGMACGATGTPHIPNITGLGTAVENPGLLQKISTALYRKGVRNSACIMFQNRENLDAFRKMGALRDGTKTMLLPGSGVNTERFGYEPYPNESAGMIFSVIGRIMKDKGTDEFLEAAEMVKKQYPDAVFRLIGYFDGDYRDKIDRAASEGLIEYYEEQEDVRPFIRDSFAVIQPSHHEGMSNVLLESAATGRPVIASDIPGCRETFEEGISGLGFPAGDARKMAETITRFIQLPHEEKEAMGRRGHEKMIKEFDRNIVADSYISAVRKIKEK